MTLRLAALDPVRVAADSPFGHALARWVALTPGARGAVLTDDTGEAVDYAHREGSITPLDLQLHGAQLAHPLERAETSARKTGLLLPTLLVEGSTGAVLAARVLPGFYMAASLGRPANLARALRGFEDTRRELATLLV